MSRTFKRGGKFCTSDKRGKAWSNRKYRRAISTEMGNYVIMMTAPNNIDEEGNLLPQVEKSLPQIKEIYNDWADLPSEGSHLRFSKPQRWLAKAI
jgi:hypothetical protein